MKGDDAAGLHVPLVDGERLGGDEVNGNRVARKRVDREHVEILFRFALERKPRIAERQFDGRRAVGKVGEVALRFSDHVRVDVVEAVGVALRAVGGDSSRAKADHADSERVLARME